MTEQLDLPKSYENIYNLLVQPLDRSGNYKTLDTIIAMCDLVFPPCILLIPPWIKKIKEILSEHNVDKEIIKRFSQNCFSEENIKFFFEILPIKDSDLNKTDLVPRSSKILHTMLEMSNFTNEDISCCIEDSWDRFCKYGFIKHAIGGVLGETITRTDNIENLRGEGINSKIREWIIEGDGRVCLDKKITDHIKELIDPINGNWKDEQKGRDLRNFAEREFSRILGIPETSVEPYLTENAITQLHIKYITYDYIMRQLLNRIFGDRRLGDRSNFYLYEKEDWPKDKSGINHPFDGEINIAITSTWSAENWFLLKCDSTCPSPLKEVLRATQILQNIDQKKCLLFLPRYQTRDAIREEIHIRRQERINLRVLSLDDLFEMLWIFNQTGKKEKVIEFLMDRVRL